MLTQSIVPGGGADTVRIRWQHNTYDRRPSLLTIAKFQTVSAIYTFFLAMTLFPEAQRTAQAELDSVIGGDRLPTLRDREELPYMEALVKEVLRWQPVTPIGTKPLQTTIFRVPAPS